jgi:hypothetical protein
MLTFADSRVFAFAPDFFEERLEPLHPLIDDSNGVYFEHVLARAIHAEMADGGGWLPLPVDPVIIGRGGTSGKTYAAGPHRVVVRSARRRLMRWLMGR